MQHARQQDQTQQTEEPGRRYRNESRCTALHLVQHRCAVAGLLWPACCPRLPAQRCLRLAATAMPMCSALGPPAQPDPVASWHADAYINAQGSCSLCRRDITNCKVREDATHWRPSAGGHWQLSCRLPRKDPDTAAAGTMRSHRLLPHLRRHQLQACALDPDPNVGLQCSLCEDPGARCERSPPCLSTCRAPTPPRELAMTKRNGPSSCSLQATC